MIFLGRNEIDMRKYFVIINCHEMYSSWLHNGHTLRPGAPKIRTGRKINYRKCLNQNIKNDLEIKKKKST